MRRNHIKQRLKNGGTVIGTMVQEMRSPSIAQVLKAVGYDFFMIDMEHGSYSLESAADILRVGRLVDMSPIVRVSGPEYHLITGPLDHGAIGIMLPRVETRAHVEKLVEAMKYPPVGKRGCSSDAPYSEYVFGPLPEFLDVSNKDTLVIVQIERKAALDNLDELLSVPGVDVALIGPEDLSVSLGIPGETSHPLVVEAIQKVIAAAGRHEVVPGIHLGSVEKLKGWMAQGMRVIIYSSDLGFIMEAGAAGLAGLRAAVE